jgi:pimeloyl-ACP methyl ester carboxylesterase
MFQKRILILFLFLSGCATLSPKFVTELQSHRVTYALAGEGSVTVVFESGLGDGMDKWEPVFDPISSFATTFAYDRPGYGRSDDVSGTRTGRDIVEHLRTLLTQVELSPPYVLVGHSSGGMYVELYARLYPDEVVGVVLVDSRHPEFTQRCEERLDKDECDIPGLMKLVMPGHMKREIDGAAQTADQIRAAPAFPDIELIVLSRNKGKESQEWLKLWQEMQLEYAKLTRRSQHIISEKSGHYVHHDDPEAVIEAVQGVIERVQDNFRR